MYYLGPFRFRIIQHPSSNPIPNLYIIRDNLTFLSATV